MSLQELIAKNADSGQALNSALGEVAAEMTAKLDAERPAREPSNHSQNNWASEIHHPCLKNLVHCRIDWKQRQPMDINGRWRVEEGNDIEWKVKKWLGNIGYELSESQRYFSTDDVGMKKFKHLHISGKIDGLNPLKKELPEPFMSLKEVPAEIKSVNPNFWNSMQTIEDIKRHSKFWLNKIPSQLNTYLVFMGLPGGFIILATFGKRPRILPMLFDAELWEYDSRRVEKVNKHVEAGTYPEPMPFDATICGMCDFNHLCAPLKATTHIEIEGIDQMELEFYLELKDWHDKYTKTRAELIGTKDKPGKYHGKDAIIEDIEIKTRRHEKKKYDIPKEKKEEFFIGKEEVVITTIDRIAK